MRVFGLVTLLIVSGCSGEGAEGPRVGADGGVPFIVTAPPRADSGAPMDGSVPEEPDDGLAGPTWSDQPASSFRRWEGYPAHPFRRWADATGAHQHIATLADRSAVAAGEAGLAIFDLEGPETRRVSTLPLPAEVVDLSTSADGRWAALAADAFVLVDVTQRAQPRLRGTFAPADPVQLVALSPDGQAAAVATRSALVTLDLADPDAPQPVGALDLSDLEALTLTADGHTAFAVRRDELLTLDLGDPAHPTVIGRVPFEGSARDLLLSRDGATLFVAAWRGVRVYDVADPAAPARLGSHLLRAGGYAQSLRLSADDETLFVARANGLELLDVSDPRAPALAGQYELPGAVFAAALVDDARALVASSAGVLLLDLRGPARLPLAGALEPPDGLCPAPVDVQLSPDGKTAYVAAPELLVVDLTEPTAPTLRATVGAAHAGSNIAVSIDGRTLCLAGEARLSVVDVTDPDQPTPLGTFDEPSAGPMDVAVSARGTTAFLATEGGGGLDVVDLADSSAPVLLGHHYVRHTRSIALSSDDQIAYLADPYENGLLIFDVSEAHAPVELARVPQSVHELALSPDGRTLVASGLDEALIIDVQDPELPRHISTVELSQGLEDVAFSADGETLFVADAHSGLRLIDLGDRHQPRLRAVLDTPGLLTDLAVGPEGDTVTVLTDEGACLATVAVGRAPSLEPLEPPGVGIRRYRLHWTDRFPDHPEHLAWHTTAGYVTLHDVDQTAGTALLDWTLPAEGPRELQLRVAVGNHHAFDIAYAVAAR